MKKGIEVDLEAVILQNLAIRRAIRKWLINVSSSSKTCEELVQDDVKIDALSMDIQEIIYNGYTEEKG